VKQRISTQATEDQGKDYELGFRELGVFESRDRDGLFGEVLLASRMERSSTSTLPELFRSPAE
jgi:hypothetical protein